MRALKLKLLMACMKLGSKSEVFHLDGNTWFLSPFSPSSFSFVVHPPFLVFTCLVKSSC